MKISTVVKRAIFAVGAVGALASIFNNFAVANAETQPLPVPPGTQQFLDTIGLNPDDYRDHGSPDNSVPCATYADSYAAADSIPGGMCPG
jgi:hypothetical protein